MNGLPRLDRAMTWIGSDKKITDSGDRCNRFVQFSLRLQLCICICFIQRKRLAQTVEKISRIPCWALLISTCHLREIGHDRYTLCLFKEDNGSTLLEVGFNVIYPIMMISAGVFVLYDTNNANHGVICSPAFNRIGRKFNMSRCAYSPPAYTKKKTSIQSCATSISRTQSSLSVVLHKTSLSIFGHPLAANLW